MIVAVPRIVFVFRVCPVSRINYILSGEKNCGRLGNVVLSLFSSPVKHEMPKSTSKEGFNNHKEQWPNLCFI